MGKPTTLIVARGFDRDAEFNAKAEGLSAIRLTKLSVPVVPLPKEIEETKLGELVADGISSSLTQEVSSAGAPPEALLKEEIAVLTFDGKDYTGAVENMEKHFLQNRWSDGFPIVPPTEEAVSQMLTGTDLPRHHVVGLVEPEATEATVEKIAINAVMAGCRPQYLPVVIAAVAAIADPKFDLRGCQCTAGPVSPLLIVSGSRLIEQLNINDSYSTVGPGWRANSTIGRAIRLIMINLGQAWPGKNDMKSYGSPFKFVMLMAEDEDIYQGAWEPLRVAEGFDDNQPTVSVYPAVTWQPQHIAPEIRNTEGIVNALAKQGKVKYDDMYKAWGMENVVVLSPGAFDAIRKEGYSRKDIQQKFYETVRVPCCEFYRGTEPSSDAAPVPIPDWIVDQCKADSNALVPLLPGPEAMKIVAAGGPGPVLALYLGTWGWGQAHFVTKPVKLPEKWNELLAKNKGWESPIEQ